MSIDGVYKIEVMVGKRRETGVATISADGGIMRLLLDAPVVGRVEAVGDVGPDDSFTASGRLRVLLKKITYTITGRVEGDTLLAVCETNLGDIQVTGTRVG